MARKATDGVGGFSIKVLTHIVAGIGLVAASLAICGFGWYLAVAYYDLKDKVSGVHLSSQVAAQSAEIEDMRRKIAEKDDEIAQLDGQLAAVERIPTDKDWEKTNDQCVLLYSTIISCLADLNLPPGDFPQFEEVADFMRRFGEASSYDTSKETPTSLAKRTQQVLDLSIEGGDLLKRVMAFMERLATATVQVRTKLDRQKNHFWSAMQGADLAQLREKDDTVYVVLRKHPFEGVNWMTGEIQKFPATSAPGD